MLARRGQRKEAVGYLPEALQLKPDYEEARKELQGLGAAPKDENRR
jgi:hypothetical protein